MNIRFSLNKSSSVNVQVHFWTKKLNREKGFFQSLKEMAKNVREASCTERSMACTHKVSD